MRSLDLLNASNADLLDSLYLSYRANPASVDARWAELFAGIEADPSTALVKRPGAAAPAAAGGNGNGNGHAHANGHAPAVAHRIAEHVAHAPAPAAHAGHTPAAHAGDGRVVPAVNAVIALVQGYRELGHLEADINPLEPAPSDHELLNPAEFGLENVAPDAKVGAGSFLGQTDGTLRDLTAKLRATYCGRLGVEFMHITDKAQRLWLQERMEPVLNRPAVSREQKLRILRQLTDAESFELYLAAKFGQSKKRFGVEGAEALIPMLEALVDESAAVGVTEVVMGMAHRGRLNVLANILHKPLEMMFAEVEDAEMPKEHEGDGDVKYHLGHSHDRQYPDGRKIHLSMCFNPSHLELVNPIVEGMVRAKTRFDYNGDRSDRGRVMPVLIHGDAAFTGQGVVMETLTLTRLRGYETGGTVHIVIDNQVGFTAEADECRFTRYPTDIMKMAQAPIFHVNADDPEAAVHAMRLAAGFRRRFGTDVMIHLLGYRRNGHNEADEPRFTQPLMYSRIDRHPSVRKIYEKALLDSGAITAEEAAAVSADAKKRLEDAYVSGKEKKVKKSISTLGGVWKGLAKAGADWSANTAVPAERLSQIMEAVSRIPEGFKANPRIVERVMQPRLKSFRDGKGLEWAVGEALAIGSLLLEGTPVRLVGQDAERGTFSHRQAVLHDIETGAEHTPLRTLAEAGRTDFTVINSMLSEEAVMGFEYGFASADPWTLVMWEAQFGDFANGAQAVIDQYLVAAESKWQRMNGLVLLLPHGYEGQGPEHSNARPERFLQLCAENNIQVCWPTTPAQYFHMLRRQMRRNFRKPLVVMTPKSLLRGGSGAVSTLAEFTDGGFRNVIDDPAISDKAARDKVSRVICCSGKVYYTLAAARAAKKLDHIAVVRIEQLYPFPAEEIRSVVASYGKAVELFWVQEEPRNMGAWRFVRNRLTESVPVHLAPVYVGRKPAASPATGSFRQHEIEEAALLAAALGDGPAGNGSTTLAGDSVFNIPRPAPKG